MVLARLGLLKVDNIVAGRAVAVAIKAELVAAETCGGESAEGSNRRDVKWVYGFTPAKPALPLLPLVPYQKIDNLRQSEAFGFTLSVCLYNLLNFKSSSMTMTSKSIFHSKAWPMRLLGARHMYQSACVFGFSYDCKDRRLGYSHLNYLRNTCPLKERNKAKELPSLRYIEVVWHI